MAFSPPYDIDPDPMGDTVSEGIEKNEGNILDAYENLNTLLAMIDAVPTTGNEILAALLPVDGIGSGLDAEYLGGRIYSEYGLAIHSHDLATPAVPGFMDSLDKQKLNGIQTGAEVNVQSDWAQTNSGHDGFIRNKPKIVGTIGVIESGDVALFHDSMTLEGKNPDEMKTYLDFFETGDFLESSIGAGDAGKPVVLDQTGLIHPSMIPAVPAQAIWGGITGTLSNQTDLQAELDLKADTGHNHDGVYEAPLGNPANDGEVLSSTAAGVRSWVPMSGGPGGVDWGDIGGTLSNQTDLQAELDAKSDTGHDHDSSYFLETEFISTSAGIGDAGKPIVLGSNGQIDPSMMDVSVFYYVGSFTPVAGTEYPSTAGESHGAFWVVQGVDAGTGYTFAGGDLAGLTVNNGDFMVWAAAGWSIMAGEMNPILYYRLDGSQPLTDHFQAGSFQLKDIADGVDASDAVSKAQLDTFLPLSGGDVTGTLRLVGPSQGDRLDFTFSGFSSHRSSTYFKPYANTPGLSLFFGGANLGDDDWGSIEFYSVGDFTVNDYQIWHEGNFDPTTKENFLDNPANDGEILSSTAAGVRSWIPAPTGGGGAVWGAITGTLSDQDDLQAELDAKAATSHDHTMSEISDLVFPVESVNGKTGALTLNAADVGALASNGKAVDSALLDGDPKSAFATSGHNHDSVYLAIGGTAADSNLFDGRDSNTFAPKATVSADAPSGGSEGDVWYVI